MFQEISPNRYGGMSKNWGLTCTRLEWTTLARPSFFIWNLRMHVGSATTRAILIRKPYVNIKRTVGRSLQYKHSRYQCRVHCYCHASRSPSIELAIKWKIFSRNAKHFSYTDCRYQTEEKKLVQVSIRNLCKRIKTKTKFFSLSERKFW